MSTSTPQRTSKSTSTSVGAGKGVDTVIDLRDDRHASSAGTGKAARTPGQLFALVSAAVYLGAGLVGFLVTGFEPFAGLSDSKILFLAVNPLHNIVHLLLGGLWLAAARRPRTADQVNALLGAGLLAVFMVGVLGAGEIINIDRVSEPDNYLHLIWGATSLVLGFTAIKQSRA